MNYSILILDRDSYTDNIPVISLPEKDIKPILNFLKRLLKIPFWQPLPPVHMAYNWQQCSASSGNLFPTQFRQLFARWAKSTSHCLTNAILIHVKGYT